MDVGNFKGWSLGMFRQFFAEQPEDKIYKAKEIAEMLEEASPLLKNEDKKRLKRLIEAVTDDFSGINNKKT